MIDSSDKRIYGALTVISSEREDLSSLNKSESGEKERLNRFGEILKRGDLTLATASEYRSADGQKITFGIISDPDKSDGEVETTDSEYKVTKEYNGSSGGTLILDQQTGVIGMNILGKLLARRQKHLHYLGWMRPEHTAGYYFT